MTKIVGAGPSRGVVKGQVTLSPVMFGDPTVTPKI